MVFLYLPQVKLAVRDMGGKVVETMTQHATIMEKIYKLLQKMKMEGVTEPDAYSKILEMVNHTDIYIIHIYTLTFTMSFKNLLSLNKVVLPIPPSQDAK